MGFTFPYRVKILEKNYLNHNVIQFLIQKPYGYSHRAGQAIELSIDKPGFELAIAPFTITNLNNDPYLELIVKINVEKGSLTHGLSTMAIGETLQITEAWNSYQYKGRGIFIAAGTGITPFLPILKELKAEGEDIPKEHTLLYANKTSADILFNAHLKKVFGNNCIYILSRSKSRNSIFGRINIDILKRYVHDFNQFFYICGPRHFETDITKQLVSMGVQRARIQTGYKF
nr:FAD-binding oxidoreductase [Arenibacter arenosicollis]